MEEQNTRGLTALHSATFDHDSLPLLNALHAIKSILRAAGGRSGNGASFDQMMETLALDEDNHVSVSSTNEPEAFEHDDRWRGAWPEPLPQDDTSASEVKEEPHEIAEPHAT